MREFYDGESRHSGNKNDILPVASNKNIPKWLSSTAAANRTRHCGSAGHFLRYFRNQPLFVIAGDDNFANKGWPVTAVINDRWFRGALVVLAERTVDPAGPPLQGETFLDGLTDEECDDARSFIGAPPGTPWVLPRRNRVRY